MAIDYQKRSGRPLGAQNFQVSIVGGAPEDEISLRFGVNNVEGLNTGALSVVRSRSGGSAGAEKELYPVTFETAPVTLTGVYLPDMEDLVKIKRWWNECAGIENHPLRGYLRNVVIVPTFFDRNGAPIEIENTQSFTLNNCICKNISFSAFGVDVQDTSNWSIEIEYEKLVLSNE